MLFSSNIFLFIFLPGVLFCYYILLRNHRTAQNIFLFFSSLFFYAWGEPRYIFLMLVSIAGNYLLGMLIHTLAVRDEMRGLKKPGSLKKFTLFITIVFNLSLLVYFKYFMLIMQTIHDLINNTVIVPDIALPIGISFFTFQGMSYVIDVYR